MVKAKDGIIEFESEGWKNYTINVFDFIILTGIPLVWIKFFQETELLSKLALMFLGFLGSFAFCIRRKHDRKLFKLKKH